MVLLGSIRGRLGLAATLFMASVSCAGERTSPGPACEGAASGEGACRSFDNFGDCAVIPPNCVDGHLQCSGRWEYVEGPYEDTARLCECHGTCLQGDASAKELGGVSECSQNDAGASDSNSTD